MKLARQADGRGLAQSEGSAQLLHADPGFLGQVAERGAHRPLMADRPGGGAGQVVGHFEHEGTDEVLLPGGHGASIHHLGIYYCVEPLALTGQRRG